LNYEVDVRNVETSGGDIGCTQDLELAFFEALHGDFSLVLSDVAMHDLDVLLDFVGQDQCVAVCLRLREHDRLAVDAAVANEDVCEC